MVVVFLTESTMGFNPVAVRTPDHAFLYFFSHFFVGKLTATRQVELLVVSYVIEVKGGRVFSVSAIDAPGLHLFVCQELPFFSEVGSGPFGEPSIFLFPVLLSPLGYPLYFFCPVFRVLHRVKFTATPVFGLLVCAAAFSLCLVHVLLYHVFNPYVTCTELNS